MFQLIALILGHIWHSGLVILRFVFSVTLLCCAELDFNAMLIIFVLISLTVFQEFPDEGKSGIASKTKQTDEARCEGHT